MYMYVYMMCIYVYVYIKRSIDLSLFVFQNFRITDIDKILFFNYETLTAVG